MEGNQKENEKVTRGPRSNQKLKILYLLKILMENTDSEHDITVQEIIDKLAYYNVTAERKSVYDDITQLESFGVKIEKQQYGKNMHYYVAQRNFELAELILLVDSVQSSKFITEKKSMELIKKLEQLASKHEASKLQRQVYVFGRVKSMNSTVLNTVDVIHNAIANNSQISFQYCQWSVKKRLELRKSGERYEISPWGLYWDDEYYYLVGYDKEADKIKHYRVDKMLHIKQEEKLREGRKQFEEVNLAAYSSKMFGMFSGEEQKVTILCENYLAGALIDRFGKDITMIKVDEDHFKAVVNAVASSHFIHWVMALRGAKIIGPESVVNQVKEEVGRLQEMYQV